VGGLTSRSLSKHKVILRASEVSYSLLVWSISGKSHGPSPGAGAREGARDVPDSCADNRHFSIAANSMFSLLTPLFAWCLPRPGAGRKSLSCLGQGGCGREASLQCPRPVALPWTLAWRPLRNSLLWLPHSRDRASCASLTSSEHGKVQVASSCMAGLK
jgi:hypothetical protein